MPNDPGDRPNRPRRQPAGVPKATSPEKRRGVPGGAPQQPAVELEVDPQGTQDPNAAESQQEAKPKKKGNK
jgi:hypothetical protein